jgi:cold shock CspA family protein
VVRYYGSIHRWNDDKGYGFIKRKDTDEELFFHISDCPKGGQRPQVGWVVSFEIGTSRQGKTAACKIQCTQFHPLTAQTATPRPVAKPETGKSRWILLIMLCGGLVYGYQQYQQTNAKHELTATAVSPITSAGTSPATETFRCDQRIYCSEMRSLAEARYFLHHCPGVKMDGDRDGEPCESQFDTNSH